MQNIKFEYEGKAYCLCYTRESISQIEAQGFNITEIQSKAQNMVPLLFYGAFFKNHRGIKRKLVDEIWSHIKSPEILEALIEMYSDTIDDLMEGDPDDPKRIVWERGQSFTHITQKYSTKVSFISSLQV